MLKQKATPTQQLGMAFCFFIPFRYTYRLSFVYLQVTLLYNYLTTLLSWYILMTDSLNHLCKLRISQKVYIFAIAKMSSCTVIYTNKHVDINII